MSKPSYLSDRYWAGLKPEHQALYLRIRPMPRATYTVDVLLNLLEGWLQGQESDMAAMGGSFELSPDFQRGHVWTPEQRVSYVESFVREMAPRTILFNCPGWTEDSKGGDIPAHAFQCIDGLQRLTTMRMFMAGELKVFGGMTIKDLEGTPFDMARSKTLQVAVYEFKWRHDLLDFYLLLNSGGTAHSKSELDRVRELQREAGGLPAHN